MLSKACVRGNALPHPKLTADAEGVGETQNSLPGARTMVSDITAVEKSVLISPSDSRMESPVSLDWQ